MLQQHKTLYMGTDLKNQGADSKPPISTLDKELIKKCLNNEIIAQERLYKRWSGKLLVIPMRYTSSRQESIEILNSSFLKIFQSLSKYTEISNGTFSGWMAKIVLNTTIDHVRKTTRYKKKFGFNIDTKVGIESSVLSDLAVEDILKLVQSLPKNSKTIFNLYIIDGYKHAEIAEMMNINTATSRWHLAEARKTLKVLINKHIFNN